MMFHVSLSTAHAYKFCLTLSLPIFWQLCSLSATFILTARGILESQANINSLKFYFFFVLFLSITFNKYPKFEVSTSIIVWTLHNVCKQRGLNKVWGGSPSRRSATLAVCYGSERVKIKKKKNAEDRMAGLQSKFQNQNAKVNQMWTTDKRTSSIHKLELLSNPAKIS